MFFESRYNGPMEILLLPVVYAVLQIFLLIGIGFFVKKIGPWSDGFFRGLSIFVVKVAIPLYIFVRISRTDISELSVSWIFIAAALAIVALGFVFGKIGFLIAKPGRLEERAGIAYSMFGNSGYFAITLTEILPFTLPVLADQFLSGKPFLYIGSYLLFHSVLLWTIGNHLISGRRGKIHLKELFSPPVIGIICGFIGLFLQIERITVDASMPLTHVFNALKRLSDVTLPLVLICLGSMIANLSLKKEKRKGTGRVLIPLSITRFILLPGCFYLAYFLFLRKYQFNTALIWILFIESHTPPALNLSVMAAQAGMNEELTSFTILITYVIFLIVLPFYLLLFFSLPGVL